MGRGEGEGPELDAGLVTRLHGLDDEKFGLGRDQHLLLVGMLESGQTEDVGCCRSR